MTKLHITVGDRERLRQDALQFAHDVAEDDREVLHSRSDKGNEWMQMVCGAINSAIDDVNIGPCPFCGEYARLTDEYARGDICDDCR